MTDASRTETSSENRGVGVPAAAPRVATAAPASAAALKSLLGFPVTRREGANFVPARGRHSNDFTRLGWVAVVVANPSPRLALAPTREAARIRDVLAGLAGRGAGGAPAAGGQKKVDLARAWRDEDYF